MLYTNNYLYIYKNVITKQQTINEVDFLIKKLCISKADSILDLACGLGRHSIELAQQGFDITGIDYDETLIEEAVKTSSNLKCKIQFYKKDIHNFIQSKSYNKIYLLYSYFGLKKFINILENIYHTLKQDGLFCFDIPNKSYFLKSNKDAQNYDNENKFDQINRNYPNVIHNVFRKYNSDKLLFEDNLYEVITIMYNLKEMLSVLRNVGFKNIEAYSNWNFTPYSESSSRIILIAKK